MSKQSELRKVLQMNDLSKLNKFIKEEKPSREELTGRWPKGFCGARGAKTDKQLTSLS